MIELRVLMVEDNVDDVELVLHELRQAGYDCTWRRVDDAASFREAIEHETWDVILSDFTMPSFAAPAALEMLKASGKDVPFIIVSGSVGESVAVAAMKAGAHDFFAKTSLTRLPAAIEREIREAQNRRERALVVDELRRTEERNRVVEKQLLDDLRLAVNARDEFLAIASHELKTPLTSMQLQLERLDRLREARPDTSVSDPAVATKLDTVERQARRLGVLIETLLDVTRITSGRLELAREPVDLAAVVRAGVSHVRDASERAGCRITVQAPEAVVGCWDPMRLETVVANLVGNSIKYGAGKPVDIVVERGRGSARLAVTDHGIGISSEQHARIFHRFERAVSSHHYGGLGLGLWIVRQIVEAHGGTVRVTSRPGDGSTFTVDLPLDHATERREPSGAGTLDIGADRRG